MTVHRARMAIATGLLSLLLLWPIGHMMLQAHFDFSPWRLFGWGMYSTPLPERAEFASVFVLPIDRSSLSESDCDPDRWHVVDASGRFRVTVYTLPDRNGEAILLSIDPLGKPALDREIRRAVIFRDTAAIEEMSDLLTYGQTGVRQTTLVVLSRLRFRPTTGTVYVENDIYRVAAQKASLEESVSTEGGGFARALCKHVRTLL